MDQQVQKTQVQWEEAVRVNSPSKQYDIIRQNLMKSIAQVFPTPKRQQNPVLDALLHQRVELLQKKKCNLMASWRPEPIKGYMAKVFDAWMVFAKLRVVDFK
eukprot:11999061-Karenia_brevis.AAC.1